MKNPTRLAKSLRYTARIILLIIITFWFVFALLSGSAEYGGGLHGIIMNSPNALPWLILFIFVYVAWKWERIGGALIIIMSIFTIIQFDTYEHTITFLAISLPLIVLGGMLVFSSYLDPKK